MIAGFLAMLPAPPSWPLAAGLGGQLGDVLKEACLTVLTLGLKSAFSVVVAAAAFAAASLATRVPRPALGLATPPLVTRVFGDRLAIASPPSAGRSTIPISAGEPAAGAGAARWLPPLPCPKRLNPPRHPHHLSSPAPLRSLPNWSPAGARLGPGRAAPHPAFGRSDPWLKLPAHEEEPNEGGEDTIDVDLENEGEDREDGEDPGKRAGTEAADHLLPGSAGVSGRQAGEAQAPPRGRFRTPLADPPLGAQEVKPRRRPFR